MLYAIMATDAKNSLEKRKLVRVAHLARLEQLKNEGRLILAGPFPKIDGSDALESGFTGSLIVAEFTNLTQAQAWIDEEPYLQSGAFESVIVKPFKQVLP